MSQPEQPWIPGPGDSPWTVNLWNLATGDRHLAFDHENGRFYRLWQHRGPEELSTAEAILLRPSDIDLIIRNALWWCREHPDDPRGQTIGDDIARSSKTLVVHFARRAGDY